MRSSWASWPSIRSREGKRPCLKQKGRTGPTLEAALWFLWAHAHTQNPYAAWQPSFAFCLHKPDGSRYPIGKVTQYFHSTWRSFMFFMYKNAFRAEGYGSVGIYDITFPLPVTHRWTLGNNTALSLGVPLSQVCLLYTDRWDCRIVYLPSNMESSSHY